MQHKILTYLRTQHTGLLALFVALGGSAYAATQLPANSVGTKQLRDHAVTGRKVAKHSLTTANIKQYSIRGDTDIKLGSVGGYTIAAGGIQTRNLKNQSVTHAKLAPGAVRLRLRKDLVFVNGADDVACGPGEVAVGGGVGAAGDNPDNGTVVTSRPAVYANGSFSDPDYGSVPNAWHGVLKPGQNGASGTVYVLCASPLG